MQEENPNKETPAQIKDQDRKLYAVLAYLGILIVIPFLIAREDHFVKFHLKQGVLLLIFWFLLLLIITMPILGSLIYTVGSLILLAFIVIGIINVLNDKETGLPLIGHLAEKFNI